MRLKFHYRQPQRRPYHLEIKCWISSENQRIALVPWIIVNLLALQIAKSVQDQMEVVEESVARSEQFSTRGRRSVQAPLMGWGLGKGTSRPV